MFLLIGMEEEDKSVITPTQAFEFRLLETGGEEIKYLEFAESLHLPVVALINFGSINDPCLACYDLGLFHSNEIPLLVIGNDLPICKRQKSSSTLSKALDSYPAKIIVPSLYRGRVLKLLNDLSDYFLEYRDPFHLMDEISSQDKILQMEMDKLESTKSVQGEKRLRTSRNILWYSNELKKMEMSLNENIQKGLGLFFYSCPIIMDTIRDEARSGEHEVSPKNGKPDTARL